MKYSKVIDRHYNGKHSKKCIVYSPEWLGFVCKYMKWGKPDILISDKLIHNMDNNKLPKHNALYRVNVKLEKKILQQQLDNIKHNKKLDKLAKQIFLN